MIAVLRTMERLIMSLWQVRVTRIGFGIWAIGLFVYASAYGAFVNVDIPMDLDGIRWGILVMRVGWLLLALAILYHSIQLHAEVLAWRETAESDKRFRRLKTIEVSR